MTGDLIFCMVRWEEMGACCEISNIIENYYMSESSKSEIMINNQIIEQVKNFNYVLCDMSYNYKWPAEETR
jgi:hypothetical protein